MAQKQGQKERERELWNRTKNIIIKERMRGGAATGYSSRSFICCCVLFLLLTYDTTMMMMMMKEGNSSVIKRQIEAMKWHIWFTHIIIVKSLHHLTQLFLLLSFLSSRSDDNVKCQWMYKRNKRWTVSKHTHIHVITIKQSISSSCHCCLCRVLRSLCSDSLRLLCPLIS